MLQHVYTTKGIEYYTDITLILSRPLPLLMLLSLPNGLLPFRDSCRIHYLMPPLVT